MISLILLSGFLGAGKTTLMTSIINNFANQKIGIIVNEFGEAGVDDVLLARYGIKMKLLNNGSIFCACLKDSFLQSLIDMSGKDISYLFIEPSGLADPSEMTKILDAISHKLHTAYNYRGVVSVVDAETFPQLSRILPALTRQVEYSCTAIINKADLVDAAQLKQVSDLVTEINPSCEIIVTSHCQVDIRGIVEKLSVVNRQAQDSTNTPESRPFSIVLKATGNTSIDDARNFIQTVMPNAYRIKGFLPISDGIITISAVGSVINIEPWTKEAPTMGLVVISAIGIGIISKITVALPEGLSL